MKKHNILYSLRQSISIIFEHGSLIHLTRIHNDIDKSTKITKGITALMQGLSL